MTTAAPLARVCATPADELALANALEEISSAYLASSDSAEKAVLTKEMLALCNDYLAKFAK